MQAKGNNQYHFSTATAGVSTVQRSDDGALHTGWHYWVSGPRPSFYVQANVRPLNHFRDQLKCDGTRAETRFRLSAKRTSPFKSAGGRQFSRVLAAEVYASAVVMLDTPCSEVV